MIAEPFIRLGGLAIDGVRFGVDLLGVFYSSFADNLKPGDLIQGLYKSLAFGLVIALTSCHFGTTVKGGAVGVGRAVNAAVVAAAIAIMLLDFFLTYLTG